MKSILIITVFLFSGLSLFAQTNLKFKILDYGIVKATVVGDNKLDVSPSGTHHWLDDMEVVKVTDSVPAKLKQRFGIFYTINATEKMELNVVTEWIFPSRITNAKGESVKSIRYTISKATNDLTASTYTFDEPFEMVKGKWIVNLYVGNKKIGSKSFIVF